MTTPEPSSPEFLIIGAQRAGTSWLWRQLRAHPHIWMPPVKELHYFDRSSSDPSSPRNATFLRHFLRRLTIDFPQWELLRWDFLYFLGRWNDEWYLSLFARGDGPVRGEATPAYSILGAQDVERIVALLPGVRVVFILRNPVERAWSQLRHDHGARIRAARMSIEEMHAFVDSLGQELRSDYARTIGIWSRHVPEARFHIGFFDHLVADPERFLASVCDFLGVAPPHVDSKNIRLGRFGAAPAFPMPPELRRHLATKYLEPIARLSDRYGDPPSQWLHDANAVLRRPH